MIFFGLPKLKTGIAKPYVLKIIFCGRIDIFSTLDIISFRLTYEESINQIIKILFQGFIFSGLFAPMVGQGIVE